MSLKRIALFLLTIVVVVLAVYIYTGRPTPLATNGTPQLTTGQSAGLSSQEDYQRAYEGAKRAAAVEPDPRRQAVLYLDAAAYLKKFSSDTDAIVSEYVTVYESETFHDEERGLALLKVSQQANGQNRYDLLNQFLPVEAHGLSAAEKNYLVNQQIFAMLPIAMVFGNMKIHEIRTGADINPQDLYAEMQERVEADITSFGNENWRMSLIPDTVMTAAALYATIDETSIPNGIGSDIVIDTLDRALALNKEYTQNNPTKDYIQLEAINYLLKINRLVEANTRVDAFLNNLPSGMIRSFVQNGGLDNGRFAYIAANADIKNRIIDGLK